MKDRVICNARLDGRCTDYPDCPEGKEHVPHCSCDRNIITCCWSTKQLKVMCVKMEKGSSLEFVQSKLS